MPNPENPSIEFLPNQLLELATGTPMLVLIPLALSLLGLDVLVNQDIHVSTLSLAHMHTQ